MSNTDAISETAPGSSARFISGSTMGHVMNMTAAASVGLISLFMVDLINLFYIARLGDQTLTAAIGYAGTIMFISISLSIGLSIAATALTARAIGAGDQEKAKSTAAASLLAVAVINIIFSLIIFVSLGWLLSMLGASGRTYDEALHFTRIVTLSGPLMGVAMCLGGLLRARGDARRAMYVTLSGGLVAAILDPLLILGLDLGITGAAYATVMTRVALVVVGYYGAHTIHRMIGRLNLASLATQIRQFMAIAVPAVLTQLATPVGFAYVTHTISEFGDDAIAGWTIVGRIMMPAFGAIFALSGAIGPIISQNYGARLYPRIDQTLRDALRFTLIYTLLAWGFLALFREQFVFIFDASEDAAVLVRFFCLVVAGSFIFNGALFVANSAFNNLGNPLLATFFNWGRTVLGILPFVYIGKSYGAEGVLAGWGLSAVVFGTIAMMASFHVVRQLQKQSLQE